MMPRRTDDRRVVTIAVTSGKGGVGKTNVVINLAVSLARLRHRVAILDADFGLGNVDVLLGLAPPSHIGHVIAGEKTLQDVMVPGPLGVRLIPATSGLRQMTALAPEGWKEIRSGLATLADSLDYLIVDTAAGISSNVIDALGLAHRVVIVTSLEPTAVVDAYAMVKVLSAEAPAQPIGILVNNAADGHEAQLVFSQLEVASRRFLKRGLEYYGFVTHDPGVREAVLMQRAIVDHLPQAPASRCFRILASRIAGMDPPRGQGMHLVTPLPAAPLPAAPPAAPATERPQCA